MLMSYETAGAILLIASQTLTLVGAFSAGLYAWRWFMQTLAGMTVDYTLDILAGVVLYVLGKMLLAAIWIKTYGL